MDFRRSLGSFRSAVHIGVVHGSVGQVVFHRGLGHHVKPENLRAHIVHKDYFQTTDNTVRMEPV